MLLENYIQRFDSVINEIRWLIEQTELAESSIAIDLDVARNRLLRMNITITAVTAFSGIGAFISGIFGMNLNSGLQTIDDPPVFWIVSGTLFFAFLLAVSIVLICSRGM
jgi:magnesium transporter